MSHLLPRLLAVGLPLAFMALLPQAAHAQNGHLCGTPPVPRLNVVINPGPVRLDTTRSMAAIKSLMPSHALQSNHVMGLSTGNIKVAAEQMFLLTALPDGRGGCASVSEMRITITMEDRVVYIAREAMANKCLASFIRTHENRHVAVDTDIVLRSRARWQGVMQKLAHDSRNSYARSANQAQEMLKARLTQMTDALWAEMRQAQKIRQNIVDTDGDYEKLKTVCNGAALKILLRAR